MKATKEFIDFFKRATPGLKNFIPEGSKTIEQIDEDILRIENNIKSFKGDQTSILNYLDTIADRTELQSTVLILFDNNLNDTNFIKSLASNYKDILDDIRELNTREYKPYN